MDEIKEFHDPDYPEAPIRVKEEPLDCFEEEKIEKIKCVIHREFSNELEARESEVMLIEQRMLQARQLLHKVRYNIVSTYYMDQKLQLNPSQIQDDVATQREPKAKADTLSTLRDGQRKIHPSVRKLLGQRAVDIEEIFQFRGPRNKTRKDYSAMLQKRNYTVSADTTKSLRPEEPCRSQPLQPKKIPRHLEPKPTNVVKLDEATRNQMKHRYRFIIGNTSKYVPAASRLDRSTHKWLLYVRGARAHADPSALLAGVRVTLHPSYAPHHTVLLHKHPFHVSRRGWGEFPAKVELHFVLPERNKPATVEHNIKLDRNYTGMQTLGSETIVDVWLYSTPEMLKYEYIEDNEQTLQTPAQTCEPMDTRPAPEITEVITKTEPVFTKTEPETDNWMDFFKTPTELDVDEMFIKPIKQEEIFTPPQHTETQDEYIGTSDIKPDDEKFDNILEVPNEIMNQPPSVKKRIVKYIDPTTGKIYYLEMDRELDLRKVQEIIINNTTTKISPIKSNGLKSVRKRKGGGVGCGGVSLLKPQVKNQLMIENSIQNDGVKQNFPHLENDHCYLAGPRERSNEDTDDNLYDSLVSVMHRFTDVKMAVNYLVKMIPLISHRAKDPEFCEYFPFVVENYDKYWRLDYAKRRNIEWSRAKLINKILTEHFSGPIWRTKEILLYIRLHGHYPIRNCTTVGKPESRERAPWNCENESATTQIYPQASDLSSLSIFKFDVDDLTEVRELSDDEDVDVVTDNVKLNVKREPPEAAARQALPVEREEDRLRFMFIEKKCADIGIELRNENVGHGYSYTCVHAVLLSALRSLAEELVRGALACQRTPHPPPHPPPHSPPHVWTGSKSSPTLVCVRQVHGAARRGRLRVLTAAGRAARHHPRDHYTTI